MVLLLFIVVRSVSALCIKCVCFVDRAPHTSGNVVLAWEKSSTYLYSLWSAVRSTPETRKDIPSADGGFNL